MNEDYKPFSSLQVMSFIAQACLRKGYPYNVTKLQKLLYCCYGVVLAVKDFTLCYETPEAWQHGPVFPSTFRYIKTFGLESLNSDRTFEIHAPNEIKSIVLQTIRTFGVFSASQLSSWSHRKGSPWSNATNNGKEFYKPLNNDLIKIYFADNIVNVK